MAPVTGSLKVAVVSSNYWKHLTADFSPPLLTAPAAVIGSACLGVV